MNRRISVGQNCYIDLEKDLFVKGIYEIPLSRMQIHILYYLAENLERPVSKEKLIWIAWGTKVETPFLRDELYVVMHRIRTRLGDNAHNHKYLISIKGFGYLLRPINIPLSVAKQAR